MIIQAVTYDDWIQVFVNDEIQFDGHSIATEQWLDFIGTLTKNDVPVMVNSTIDLHEHQNYFTYSGTPKSGYQLREVLKHLQYMRDHGYYCNDDGNWIKE